MNFNVKQTGRKSNKNKSFIKLLKPPTTMVSGTSTIVLSSDPHELCDRLKLFLQEKQAASDSKIIDEEIVAKVDKTLE